MIRSVSELRKVCRDDADFAEAVRFAGIDLQVHAKANIDNWTPTRILAEYFQFRATPHWQRVTRTWNPEAKTIAQLVAVHGGTDSLAKAADCDDLIAAVKLIGDYNDFDPDRVKRAFSLYRQRRYYGGNNPNTGGDLFDYWVGWECSTVIYVAMSTYGHSKRLTGDGKAWLPYGVEEFRSDMKGIEAICGPDESSEVEFTAHSQGFHIKHRFWWD
jgi:hypothetical protein